MTSPYGPMVLIANLKAGRGRVAAALPEVRSHLEQRELEYEIRETKGPGDASKITREVLDAGGRFVVAVGGDGTVHEVVNGMIENDTTVNPEAVFGVVAAGTGCDFIKTFGIPAMPGHSVANLDGGEMFPIDIGKITFQEEGREVVRYFANIAEVGIGAATVKRAATLPRFLGPTVYFFAFWMTLRKHHPAKVKIDLVDRTYEGYMNNLVVANGQFFGGGMKVAPKAAPTDGL
ncbi:MAG: diacylglycerol kinase, partial [Actinomycetota bacterium]|nr:diacylglycerol kinase [Actinomycetota bacterium]